MWVPDSIQISKELIKAEMYGKIPRGTTVAAAAFMMLRATRETAPEIVETLSLDKSAAKVAWIFLNKGQIVTTDGEILTETNGAASPAPIVQNPVTVPSDSESTPVRVLLRQYFPNWVAPTEQQVQIITENAPDMKVVDDALYVFANGKQEIRNPITLLIWKLKNATPEQIAQERAIIDNQGRSGDSIVRAAMRKAEAEIPNQPTPEVTDSTVDQLRQLRELVQSGTTD